jgi:hypothetical protein
VEAAAYTAHVLIHRACISGNTCLEINIVCIRIQLGSDNARIGATRTSNLTSGTKRSLTGLGLWELGLDAGMAAIGIVFATV